MIQLPAIVLMSALHAGLSIAQQHPLPVTYDTVIKSAIDPSITISYKTPDAHTCATAFEAQKQYSGYVNLSPFTLEPFQQNYSINTFFWFFEARENPEAAPLTIWLNGGPGSSSMLGLFTEMGPCEIVDGPDGRYTTQPRVWGWDRSSNILFIDQPTQVGFSYDERVNASIDFSEADHAGLDNHKEASPLPVDVPDWRFKNGTFSSGITTNTEDLTAIAARSSWHFLQGFLSVFPQYNPGTRPGSDSIEPCHINLFAESYGGTYGPIFADYYQDQNDRREKGEISSEALDIRLGSIGIVNGILDVYVAILSGLKFAYNNTYGIEGIDLTTYQNAVSELNADMGCRDLITQCGALAALNDPEGLGTDQDVNNICAGALYTCTVTGSVAYSAGRNVYDFRVSPTVGPPAALSEYLNEEDSLQSVGAPVNFTSSSITVENAFNYNGDSARGGQIDSLAGLLARGIKVAFIYGDADVICNWYGGQNYSLQLASLVPAYKTAFPEAGYADIVVNDSYIGGAVRQYGNLSFSRIYDAGHQVPFYQPETAFTVFSRIIQGDDISMGRNVDLSSFGTEGPSTSDHTNVVGPEPASVCWIRDAAVSCTQEELAAIAAGKGTVKAGIWYRTDEDTPTSASQDQSSVPKSQPTATTPVSLTGVFSATTTPTIKQTSGASSLRLNLPFRLPRHDIPASLELAEAEKARKGERTIRHGLISGLAAAAALLLGLLSMLCCWRCFRRRKVYEGPFPDDSEKGPIVVKQVNDDSPAPIHFSWQRTHMEPIPEASPRPSYDMRDRAATVSNQAMNTSAAEGNTVVSQVQRSVSLPQGTEQSACAPRRRPTEVVQAPLTSPSESGVIAPRQWAVSVPPTPPKPLPTATALIRTPLPAPAQPTPPAPEPTPSTGPVSTSVQHKATSPPSSSLRTPTSVPLPPDPQPKIDPSPALPQPSLFTRIKSIFIPTSRDSEATAQTDGAVDRRVLLPRIAVRPPPPKRAPKAAIPTWSTEVVL